MQKKPPLPFPAPLSPQPRVAWSQALTSLSKSAPSARLVYALNVIKHSAPTCYSTYMEVVSEVFGQVSESNSEWVEPDVRGGRWIMDDSFEIDIH